MILRGKYSPHHQNNQQKGNTSSSSSYFLTFCTKDIRFYLSSSITSYVHNIRTLHDWGFGHTLLLFGLFVVDVREETYIDHKRHPLPAEQIIVYSYIQELDITGLLLFFTIIILISRILMESCCCTSLDDVVMLLNIDSLG